jgi:DNA-binding HxlR family transcriptional regulator
VLKAYQTILKKIDPANYEYCDSPFACAAAPIISRKWVPVVVCHLLHGPKRYNELKRAIPLLSSKVLTQNLRELEEEKILTRRVYKNSTSPSFEAIYELTNKGRDLSSVIFAMNSWGKKWLRKESASKQKMLPTVNAE